MNRKTIGMILMIILSAIVIFGVSIGMAGKASARPIHTVGYQTVSWDPPKGCRDCEPCLKPWMTACKNYNGGKFVFRRAGR